MVIIIKKITKFTVDKTIIIPMILFGIISVATIFCTRELLEVESQNLLLSLLPHLYSMPARTSCLLCIKEQVPSSSRWKGGSKICNYAFSLQHYMQTVKMLQSQQQKGKVSG